MKEKIFDHKNRTRMLNACRKAFWYKNVNMLLGFTLDINGKAVPLFIDNSDDLEKLVWNNTCKQKLAKYLLNPYFISNQTKKMAIIAKPCDAKVIKEYLSQNKFYRKQIHIIGIECHGMKNEKGVKYLSCIDCKDRVPLLYDTLIRFEPDSRLNDSNNNLEKKINFFDKLMLLDSEINNCTLCFSCRHVCPGCDYDECFVNKANNEGIDYAAKIGVKLAYHFLKAVHLSKKCISCGLCEKVCPSGIKVKQVMTDILNLMNCI